MHFGKPVVPLDVTIPVMSYGRTRRAENFPVAGPRARSAVEGTPEEALSTDKRCCKRSLGFNSLYKESKSCLSSVAKTAPTGLTFLATASISDRRKPRCRKAGMIPAFSQARRNNTKSAELGA